MRVEPRARSTSTPLAPKQLSYRYHSPSRTTSFVEHLSFPLPVHSAGLRNQTIKTKAALSEECSPIDFIALLLIRELTKVVEEY